MHATLSEPSVIAPVRPPPPPYRIEYVFLDDEPVNEPLLARAPSAKSELARTDVADDSLEMLVNDLAQRAVTADRSDIITAYQGWIRRNAGTSTIVFAAWFNVGVELAAAGDTAGAIEAYQNALALAPGFAPAAGNLAALLLTTEQPAPVTVEAPAAPCINDLQAGAQVLHVGCGGYHPDALPPVFRTDGWREIRLDIDPDVKPDFVASLTDMRVIPDNSVDAVYSSHNIEHLYPHDVPVALREFRRVLKAAGYAFVALPDLQEVARHIAADGLEALLYVSPMGPITPLDILFGHRGSLASGNLFMAHHTGFTDETLAFALIQVGFAAVIVQRVATQFSLNAIAFRDPPTATEVTRAQNQLAPDFPAILYTPSA